MRLINEQDVFDIIDDLRDRMTVEGYCAMVERVKALPSATCGNLEKPEIPQYSEGEAADCNLDCISRQMLLEYIHGEPVGKLLCDKYNLDGLIEQFPSAQPEQTDCEYCHEDSDGYVKPIEKNNHAFVRFGMNGWEINLSAKGWNGSAKIMYCPMCGRRLKHG